MVSERINQLTASRSFIEGTQDALDSGLYAIGLFFDLSKACDVIDHNILLDTRFIWYKRCVKHVIQVLPVKQIPVCRNIKH
jgi:hypothetical protein